MSDISFPRFALKVSPFAVSCQNFSTMSLSLRKPKRRRRKRRDDESGPPPSSKAGWSGKKMLLVLLAVFGVPLLILVSVGRTDIINAMWWLLLGFAGLVTALTYLAWRVQSTLDDEADEYE